MNQIKLETWLIEQMKGYKMMAQTEDEIDNIICNAKYNAYNSILNAVNDGRFD